MRPAVLAGVGLLVSIGGCQEPDPVDRLARGTPVRLLEARLAGPFPTGPCPKTESGIPSCSFPETGSPGFEALAAATSEVEASTDPAAPRARALAELLWSTGGLGSAAASAEALAQLAVENPGDPDLLSDWAAAELTRGAAEGRAYPDVLALEAAERALAADPDHAPARYNRALALDRLGFGDLAARAWSAYLEVDAGSPWADEARRHRDLLGPTGPDGRNPQVSRERVLDSILPAWGRALQAGDPGEARRLLARAEELAGDLAAGSVARSVEDVARVWATSPGGTTRMASALVEFGEGRRHYQARRDDRAVPHLAAAADGLDALSPDLRDWASVWLGAVALGDTRYGEVEERLAPIMARHDPRESPVLFGLSGWLRGVAFGRRGLNGLALRHHQAAAEAMSRSGEAGYIAFLWTLVAEDQTLLGNSPEAWEARRRSFRVFRRADDPDLLRGALVPAVDDLRRSGLLHAALVLQDYAVLLSGAGMAPNLASEDRVRRATLLRELGREAEARRDLEVARAAIASVQDETNRAWSQAQVWAEEGILAGRGPDGQAEERALALLDSAASFHRSRDHGYHLVDLHLERSRLHRRRGQLEEAGRELRAALALVEGTRATIDDPADGIRFADASRHLWDEGLPLELLARGDPWSALHLTERIRGLTTPRWEVPAAEDLRTLPELPEDLAVVAYVALEDSLFVWVVGRRGGDAVSLPVSREVLRDAVLQLGRQARTSRSAQELRPAADRAARLLLPDTIRTLLGGRDVAFVPDPLLSGLPFSALAGEEGWLLEERAVSVVPSLTFLRAALHRGPRPGAPSSGGTLVVADPAVAPELQERYPPLPATREELATLRSLYPEATVLEGRDAHPSALVQRLDRSIGLLHFAGHAVSAPEVPGGSHLVLAPDPSWEGGTGPGGGFLYAHDLALGGFQGPELVVLTACSSVAPRPGSLAGFQGIALPFLEQGTAAVVGTLWEVEDRGAARIASHFHRGWAEGLTARDALRRAQLQALRDGDTPTGVWAGFQVVGITGNPGSTSVASTAQASTEQGDG